MLLDILYKHKGQFHNYMKKIKNAIKTARITISTKREMM